MPDRFAYDLFISHARKFSPEYYSLVEKLDALAGFAWHNHSVPEHDPVDDARRKEELREQIRPVGAVLILSGTYAAHSEWVQFEMDFAASLSKPIIGIAPWDGQVTPSAVQEAATAIVRWSIAPIVTAVREHSL